METPFDLNPRPSKLKPTTSKEAPIAPHQDKPDSSPDRDLLDLAQNFFDQGQLERAEQILQQMIMGQKADNDQIFYLLGAIYYDRGKHQKAEIAFRRALDINPDSRDAAIALTILYNDVGEYEKAQQIYQQTRQGVEQNHVGKDPHLTNVFSQKHEQLGDLYSEHEFHSEAFHEYEKAAKHTPDRLDLVIKAARSLEKSGASKAAIDQLKNLKNTYPESIACRLALGMLYFNAHHIPEAVSEWEAILRREPGNKEAALYLRVAAQTQMTDM